VSGRLAFESQSTLYNRPYSNLHCLDGGHNVEGMKSGVWVAMDQKIIDNAIAQWRQRLRACVQAEGWHFEHLF